MILFQFEERIPFFYQIKKKESQNSSKRDKKQTRLEVLEMKNNQTTPK